MDCLSRHAKLSTQGADAWSYYAVASVMRVMDARARARVQCLRKRTREFIVRVTESIRKIAGQRQRRCSLA